MMAECAKILLPSSNSFKTAFLALVILILSVFSLLNLYFTGALISSIKYACG
jgi:hypothetical protein